MKIKEKQRSFIPENPLRLEHGGTLALKKRRKARPLSVKKSIHLVLRSDFAYGPRNLLRHRPLIQGVIKKASNRFNIRIYELGIVSNHIHILVRGKSRVALQNFFRVVAGHIAQFILMNSPILRHERPLVGESSGGAPKATESSTKVRETENKFWQTRIYSRIISWGKEYLKVKAYVIQNDEEARGLRPYKTRRSQRKKHP